MYKTVFNTYPAPEMLEHGIQMALANGAAPEDLTLMLTEEGKRAWDGIATFTPEPEEVPAPAEGEEAPEPVMPEPRPYFDELEVRRWKRQEGTYRVLVIGADAPQDPEEALLSKAYRTAMDARRVALIVQQHMRG